MFGNVFPGEIGMIKQDDSRRHCRKCLLREMDAESYFKNLYDYIERLDPDIKADEELYQERLEKCKGCERLLEGMCRACGCFVELRAVIKKNACPYDRW